MSFSSGDMKNDPTLAIGYQPRYPLCVISISTLIAPSGPLEWLRRELIMWPGNTTHPATDFFNFTQPIIARESQHQLVDRPTQLICISDIYLLLFVYVNRQIQKT